MKATLNKYLKELDKKELEAEIKKLYAKFSNVKQYYNMELSQDTTAILNEYKNKVRQEYFPKRGYGQGRNGVSRKVVNDFKKISIFKSDLIELILCRVGAMIEFTTAYGDIDEPFYNSLESSFEEACKLIKVEKLEQTFKAQCKQLVADTYEFGWGLHDGMTYIFERHLGS